MPSRYIQYVPNAAGWRVPGAASFGVDSDDGRIYIHRGASEGREPMASTRVKILTADYTATTRDDGTLFVADSTTTITVTIPATAAGMRFGLVVKQLTSSGGHAISPAAADKIMGNGFTAADDKDAICTAATDRVGDVIWLKGDGVDGYFIESVVGTWARE